MLPAMEEGENVIAVVLTEEALTVSEKTSSKSNLLEPGAM